MDNASKGSIESAPINLSKKESEFLLLTIKNALFKGCLLYTSDAADE